MDCRKCTPRCPPRIRGRFSAHKRSHELQTAYCHRSMGFRSPGRSCDFHRRSLDGMDFQKRILWLRVPCRFFKLDAEFTRKKTQTFPRSRTMDQSSPQFAEIYFACFLRLHHVHNHAGCCHRPLSAFFVQYDCRRPDVGLFHQPDDAFHCGHHWFGVPRCAYPQLLVSISLPIRCAARYHFPAQSPWHTPQSNDLCQLWEMLQNMSRWHPS